MIFIKHKKIPAGKLQVAVKISTLIYIHKYTLYTIKTLITITSFKKKDFIYKKYLSSKKQSKKIGKINY